MPITLRMVLEIAASVDLPIVGVGGVSSAEDVLQYIMAGAHLVGICTAGHVDGIRRYTRIIDDLARLLEDLGVENPGEVRGLTLKRIEGRKQKGLQAVTAPVVPTVLTETCNGCGNCERVCVYEAARIEDKIASIDPELCTGCGLCISVCPVDALVQEYYPE
jgi:ferredoxin